VKNGKVLYRSPPQGGIFFETLLTAGGEKWKSDCPEPAAGGIFLGKWLTAGGEKMEK